jgi:hypothetical protein
VLEVSDGSVGELLVFAIAGVGKGMRFPDFPFA